MNQEIYTHLEYYYYFCHKNNLLQIPFHDFIQRLADEMIIDKQILKLYTHKIKKLVNKKYKGISKDNLKINDTILWFSKGKLYSSQVIKKLPSFIKIKDYDPITKGKIGYGRKIYIKKNN